MCVAQEQGQNAELPPLVETALGDLGQDRSRGWPVLLGFHVLPGLLATLLMPAIGLAVDRWGPRRIITTGMIVLAGALLLSLGAQTDGIMLLTAATVGGGGALASWVPVATAINNWFHRRRAFAMASGFVLWAIASAPLWLASPAAGYLDDQAGIPAPVTIAALVCVLIWPVRRIMRDRPEPYGQTPYGLDPKRPDPGLPAWQWREALTSRTFWLLTLGSSGWAMASTANYFKASIMVDHGFTSTEASLMPIITGLVAAPATLVAGWLADQIPIRRILFTLTCAQCAGALTLALAHTLPVLYVSAILVGLASGGGMVLVLAAMGHYFGRRNFGVISGTYLMVIGVPGFSAGLVAGLLQYATASWLLTVLVAIALSAPLTMAYLFVSDVPQTSPKQARKPDHT